MVTAFVIAPMDDAVAKAKVSNGFLASLTRKAVLVVVAVVVELVAPAAVVLVAAAVELVAPAALVLVVTLVFLCIRTRFMGGV